MVLTLDNREYNAAPIVRPMGPPVQSVVDGLLYISIRMQVALRAVEKTPLVAIQPLNKAAAHGAAPRQPQSPAPRGQRGRLSQVVPQAFEARPATAARTNERFASSSSIRRDRNQKLARCQRGMLSNNEACAAPKPARPFARGGRPVAYRTSTRS